VEVAGSQGNVCQRQDNSSGRGVGFPGLVESADRYKRQPQAKTNAPASQDEYPVGVPVTVFGVCVRSDMPAYSHFKMASIFLSQQNGDCKIVLLAQLQRSVKKLLCVCEARDGCVMRYTEENCA